MATVEERLTEIYVGVNLTCAQLDGLIAGIEDMLENDPGMPEPERVRLVQLVNEYKLAAKLQHCPPVPPEA